jgi:hypothetical protein
MFSSYLRLAAKQALVQPSILSRGTHRAFRHRDRGQAALAIGKPFDLAPDPRIGRKFPRFGFRIVPFWAGKPKGTVGLFRRRYGSPDIYALIEEFYVDFSI